MEWIKQILTGLYIILLVNANAQHFTKAESLVNNYTFGQEVLFGGGGISFVDFNQDGWDDLTLATADSLKILFFINNEGVFTQVPELVGHDEDARQVIWVDYDNDNDLDFFVATFGGFNRLYRNDGDLSFTDVTIESGFGFINDLSYGASFGDIDNDGDLDVYISNQTHPLFHPPVTTNFLYRNNNGYFENVTIDMGVSDSIKLSFCSIIADFDGDMHQDIYVVNDRVLLPNALFMNNGDDSFSEMGYLSDGGIGMDAMNGEAADYDYDGDLDIYITNTAYNGESALLENDGMGYFVNVATDIGINHVLDNWGGSFLDIDNDTDMDLFVSSGYSAANPIDGILSLYYLNDGTGNFASILMPDEEVISSLANAYGDFNNDGKLDVVEGGSLPYNFALWENITANDASWVKVKLEGTESNKQGIGSWIDVYADGMYMNRYALCGQAFLAQNSDKIHFGLGNNTKIDSLIVRWPSGIVDKYYDLGINQVHFLTEEETIDTTNNDDLLAGNSNVSIFPNPSTQLSYTLKSQELLSFSYRLLNAEGKQIMVGQEIMNAQDSNFNLETSHLSEGIYFLEIQFEDGSSITKKWICKK